MRINTLQVYEAWRKGKSKQFKAISTDGRTIWSYKTPIMWWDSGKIYINISKFSITTTKQQNALLFLAKRDGLILQHCKT